MAVVITSPKYTTLDVTNNHVDIEWTTSTEGQEAYELQYKFKKDEVWRTCGKVYDKLATSVSTEEIYRVNPVDFYELYYRIVIYYDGDNSLGHISGYEISDAYAIIFTHYKSTNIHLWDGSGIITYPLFETVNVDESRDEVRKQEIALDEEGNEKLIIPLVTNDNPLASNLKVCVDDTHGNEIKVAAKDEPSYTNTNIYGCTYLNQYIVEDHSTYAYGYVETYGVYGNIASTNYYEYMPGYDSDPTYGYYRTYIDIPTYDYMEQYNSGETYNYYNVYNYEPSYGYKYVDVYRPVYYKYSDTSIVDVYGSRAVYGVYSPGGTSVYSTYALYGTGSDTRYGTYYYSLTYYYPEGRTGRYSYSAGKSYGYYISGYRYTTTYYISGYYKTRFTYYRSYTYKKSYVVSTYTDYNNTMVVYTNYKPYYAGTYYYAYVQGGRLREYVGRYYGYTVAYVHYKYYHKTHVIYGYTTDVGYTSATDYVINRTYGSSSTATPDYARYSWRTYAYGSYTYYYTASRTDRESDSYSYSTAYRYVTGYGIRWEYFTPYYDYMVTGYYTYYAGRSTGTYYGYASTGEYYHSYTYKSNYITDYYQYISGYVTYYAGMRYDLYYASYINDYYQQDTGYASYVNGYYYYESDPIPYQAGYYYYIANPVYYLAYTTPYNYNADPRYYAYSYSYYH